jgi:hypothetical protein
VHVPQNVAVRPAFAVQICTPGVVGLTLHSRTSRSRHGQAGSFLICHVHSCATLWQTALAVLAHKGQFAPLVQSLTLVQAMLPHDAVSAARGGRDAHWVKHKKRGRARARVTIRHLDTARLGGIFFILSLLQVARAAKSIPCSWLGLAAAILDILVLSCSCVVRTPERT